MTTELVLYIGNTCGFCLRVTEFLHKHPMNIQIKDVWSDQGANQELMALTGKSQVPCLRIGNSYMHESLDIIEKLKEMHSTADLNKP